MKTENGKIIISGAIDRVDEAIINDKKYIRVVDYKSSGKEFALSDVVQGLNMQMFIYLFTLWQNGTEKYGEFTPAGVLYYPANSPLVSVSRGTTDEEIEAERQKKCTMTGIVLDNSEVIKAMDSTESGTYIPVRYKGGEFIGSLIGVTQLEKLKEKADSVLAEMADALHSGSIEAVPAFGESYKYVCDYCDYKAVCSYEDNIPQRILLDDDLKTVIENLEKGDEADEMDNRPAESD